MSGAIAFIAVAITVILLGNACSKSSYPSNNRKYNLAAMYYPLSSKIHPSYTIYHNTHSNSLLYVKIFSSELQFIPSGVEGVEIAKVDLEYNLFETVADSMFIVDSNSYNFSINEQDVGKRFITQIPLHTDPGKSYQLQVICKDRIRKSINIRYIDINKTNKNVSQYYSITNHNDIPYFTNIVRSASYLKVKMAAITADKLYIKYYNIEPKLPKPTFADLVDTYEDVSPDSVFVMDYNPSQLIQLAYKGQYIITADTSVPGGVLLNNYGKNYPKVETTSDMITPVQYIATVSEYRDIEEAANKKLALDKFWEDKGDGMSRGRELIRIFYNRVYFSNYYFTASNPGWATDRGMVYVMYGPPQKLEVNSNTETWYYYYKGRDKPIEFTFQLKPADTFNNNYILARSNNHDWHWQQAVTAWRNGKIFLQD